MREFEPFDPNHPRCKHPVYGANFDKIMMLSGLSAVQVAKAAGISVDVVRGYRRGFYKPSRESQSKLEGVFGTTLTPPDTANQGNSGNEPFEPTNISFPDYFKVEGSAFEPETGDWLVTFRVPKEKVDAMLGGMVLQMFRG